MLEDSSEADNYCCKEIFLYIYSEVNAGPFVGCIFETKTVSSFQTTEQIWSQHYHSRPTFTIAHVAKYILHRNRNSAFVYDTIKILKTF